MANPIRPPHKIKSDSKTSSGQGGRTIGVRPVSPAGSGRTARHNSAQTGGQSAERTLPKPAQNTASTVRPNPVVKPAHTVSRQTSAPAQTARQAQAAKQLEQLLRTTERTTVQHSGNTTTQTTARTTKPSLGKAARTGVALGAGSALLGALLSGAMRSGQSLKDLRNMPELQGMSEEELRRAMEELQQDKAGQSAAADAFASTVECSHCGAPIPAGAKTCEYCGCLRTGEEEKL
ncbi:MAG: zinc ribbon domain-containing protein [Firmicutes bacterium]|nr:zinc ribbon domain-containing protein [Bacillota bacterium]